jgi:O-antigen/teichoic acid export membrane protein
MINQKQTLVKNAATNWLAIGLNIVIFFFLTPFVINKIGQEAYGIWVLIISITTFMQLMDFGMAGALRRFISHYEAIKDTLEIENIISNITVVYFIICSVSIIITILLYLFALPNLDISNELIGPASFTFLIVGFDISLLLFFNLFSGTIFALQRFDLNNYGQIAVVLIRSSIFVVLLENGYGLQMMAVTIIGVNILNHIYKVIIVYKIYPDFKINLSLINKKQLKKLSSFSTIGFLTSISNVGLQQMPLIIIGAVLGAIPVTYYVIAQSLVGYVQQMIGAVSGVTGPVISRFNSLGERDKVKSFLIDGQRYIAILTFWVCGGLLVFGENFLTLWLGDDFAEKSMPSLSVLSVAIALSLPQNIAHNVLFNINKHKQNAIITGTFFLFSISLQLILINLYQVAGVVYAILISTSVIYIFVMPKYICKTVEQSIFVYFKNVYLKPLLAFVPFIVFALFINHFNESTSYGVLIFNVIISSVVYFCSTYIFAVKKHERESLLGIFQSVRNKIYRKKMVE